MKRRGFGPLAILLAVVLVGTVGCDGGLGDTPSADPSSGASTSGGGATIEGPQTPDSLAAGGLLRHTQFATSIDDTGVAIDEGDAFPVGTTQILALVAWAWAPVGTELRLRLFQDDRFIFEYAHTVANEKGRGIAIPLVVHDGFPAGAFAAEISWNGVPDEVATFTVGDAARENVVVGSGEGSGPIAYAAPDSVLVVTRVAALTERLGGATESVLEAARRVGDFHDLEADGVSRATPEAAGAEVHRLLAAGSYRYLLILGNDDVVPYFRVKNSLADDEAAMLADTQLPAEWLPSDDPYTDLDGDANGVPDLAAARIPSSDDAELLLTQLGDGAPPDGRAFALINQERRSQAAAVISAMGESTAVQLEYAPPTDALRFEQGPGSSARYLYIILHGIGVATESWTANLEQWTPADPAAPYAGEWTVKPRDAELAAVTIANNPGSRGIVDVGACYGAWTLDTVLGETHKTADNNLALHYLKSGVRAFIGDTHLSYSSPNLANGTPLGRTGFERVFWRGMSEGLSPIDAFQRAKVEVADAIDKLVAAGYVDQAKINEKTVHYMVFLGRP